MQPVTADPQGTAQTRQATSLPRTVRVDPRLTLRLAALFALIAGALLAWLGSAYYHLEADNEQALRRADNERILRLASLAMSEALTSALSDLRFFSRSNELDAYLLSESPTAAQNLAREFAHLVVQKNDYDQVRFLGPDGRERIRVDNAVQGAVVTPADRLQDKSSRYYFKDMARLRQSEIYVSPLDLNVENGQIEQPLKPVIRLGLAIHDPLGVRRGYLLINYRAERLLNRLHALGDSGHDLWLLDARGEWLLGATPDDTWSGQLPQRAGRGFARRYPDAWRVMQRESAGSVPLAETRVQYIQVHPLLNGLGEGADTPRLAQPAAAQVYSWYALIANSPAELAARHARLNAMAVKGGLVMGFLVLAAAAALAYAIARQRALARSLEQAVDNVPVLIAYIDADARFRFNNRAWLDTYGITPKAMFGRHVREIFGTDGYRLLQPHLEMALAGQRAEFELFLEQGPGPHDLAITFVPDVSAAGRGLYALITDITQRRAVERREREHQQELVQVSRLASVGEITSEIAHQINQPLAAIAMFSNAAQRTLEKGGEMDTMRDKLRGWMETINAQAKRASEVVQRLRRFAHQGEIRSQPLDLNESVREAAALVESDARARQVEFVLDLAEPLPNVMAAGILMEQVIYNLLHNAIRSAVERGSRVTVHTHADADWVWLQVRDQVTGSGTEENDYSIEPGVEQMDQGFGVGLSISRSIVTSYAGDIICRHNKVGGSQVSFYLPRLEP